MRNEPWALFLLLALGSFGCVQKMGTQGHAKPFSKKGSLWVGRKSPEGTVPQGEERISPPTRLTRALIERGRDQYNTNCLPCHGPSGYGNGMVVQRGFLAPPSYHEKRLVDAPDEHFVDVITHGLGAMYSYADRVTPSDRWAVVAYIRALQKSQNVNWWELSEKDRQKLNEVTSE